jgi:hypothetical protein
MNLRVANNGRDLTAGLKNDKPMQDLCTEENDKIKGYGTELLLGIARLDEKCGNAEIDDEYVNKRWPTRVFYGKDGELKHPYTRMEKPNLNLMSCRYHVNRIGLLSVVLGWILLRIRQLQGWILSMGGVSTASFVRKKWH